MNIVDPILFQCQRQPPAPAICVPGPGIGLISYRRLEQFIHNISRRLVAVGVAPGNIVVVSIQDIIFHSAVLLALTRLGITTMSVRADISSVPFPIDALITEVTRSFANVARVIPVDLSWTEGDGRPLESHFLHSGNSNDLCRIILTSGTTGEAKAVALSHRLLADRITRHLSMFGNRMANYNRIYSDIPVSSSLGFQFLIYTLWRGGTMFFAGETFESTLRVFEEYKVQCMIASPGGFEVFLRGYNSIPQQQSALELLFCGGDILSKSLSERIRARMCSHLIAAYGSTEASMTAATYAHSIENIPAAVGFITPGNIVQIVDDTGRILPPGQEGLLRIRSEYAVTEYLNNSEESKKVFRNGWFYPGDIGAIDANNLLTITGREQSVLNVGGDKINPERIESVLTLMQGVTEAAAFTAPNPLGVNEICVAVVTGDAFDERMIREHCTARLPASFVPTRIFKVDRLDRNEMGKIDRRKLLDLTKSANTNH